MLIRGDLFDVLPTLAEASIDACVTDPPYGIGFMGREWDTFKPGESRASKGLHANQRIGSVNPNLRGRRRAPAVSPSQIEYDYTVKGLRGFQEWTAQWATEVLRVLKPGAYLVVCGAPRSHHRMMCGLEDAGFVIRDCFAWLFGSGFPKNLNLGEGRGTALKPAHEPIALAWKPFKGTITANVARYGTGALNIDACRIAAGEGDYDHWREPGNIAPHEGFEGKSFAMGRRSMTEPHDLGRWPANVLLDDEAAAMLDEQTGTLARDAWTADQVTQPSAYWSERGGTAKAGYGDVGGASRFYYVAKPSNEERGYGLNGARSTHPTVKPVELMRWLVKLVTPIGGTVLDPFTGSGTTGMACRYEQRAFIGIEKEAEYLAIAERRIAAVAPLFADVPA